MTREDIIIHTWQRTPHSKPQVKQAVNTIIEAIKEELGNHGKVTIRGLGEWTVKRKNERMGRNPKTGESVPVSERMVVRFKASKTWKERMND